MAQSEVSHFDMCDKYSAAPDDESVCSCGLDGVLDMMKRLADKLSEHRITTVDDGEYAEDFNNEDVIELLAEYEARFGD